MRKTEIASTETASPETETAPETEAADAKKKPKEVGGRKGPDPTRYGDWEKKGVAVDF